MELCREELAVVLNLKCTAYSENLFYASMLTMAVITVITAVCFWGGWTDRRSVIQIVIFQERLMEIS